MRRFTAMSLACAACLGASILPGMSATAATVTTIYKFTGKLDGDQPSGPLIADPQGNLYGTTFAGGAKDLGVIFRLAPPAVMGGTWTQTVLHDFTNSRQGYAVNPPLTLDTHGNLFGTTFDGGSCYSACGVAFRLSPGSTQTAPWRFTVLYRFSGPDAATGGAPQGSLISDGTTGYFGTTLLGGGLARGTVFHITPRAGQHGGWSESVIYSFGNIPDGNYPVGAVVADAQGNLYGATEMGGRGRCNDGEGGIIGCGTIFQLSKTGSNWSEALIYQFKANEFNQPFGPLVFGADGALYGVAGLDIFRVTPPAKGVKTWTKQVVYQFKDGIAGTEPYDPVFDSAGNLYGTTVSSGLSGFSTVFKLVPPKSGTVPWSSTILARFGHGLSTEQPSGTVLLGSDGTLYGTLADRDGSPGHGHGSIFAVTP